MSGSAHYSAVAQVVGNDDGGVEGLEVQDQQGVGVEAGLWLQNEGYCLHGWLIGHLHQS